MFKKIFHLNRPIKPIFTSSLKKALATQPSNLNCAKAKAGRIRPVFDSFLFLFTHFCLHLFWSCDLPFFFSISFLIFHQCLLISKSLSVCTFFSLFSSLFLPSCLSLFLSLFFHLTLLIGSVISDNFFISLTVSAYEKYSCLSKTFLFRTEYHSASIYSIFYHNTSTVME